MTKVELKKLIAEQQDISQKLADEYIEAVFEGIKEGLRMDGKVALQGLVQFEIRDTKPSSGIINGVEWSKPAGKRIAVKVSDSFERDVID